MKVTYDSRTDTLTVVFREDVQVAESDEDKPGIVLDYDEAGNLISVEILDASSRVSDAGQVHFQRTG
jgi:YD repeat-containing protein